MGPLKIESKHRRRGRWEGEAPNVRSWLVQYCQEPGVNVTGRTACGEMHYVMCTTPVSSKHNTLMLTLEFASWKCDCRPFVEASLYERKSKTVAGNDASAALRNS